MSGGGRGGDTGPARVHSREASREQLVTGRVCEESAGVRELRGDGVSIAVIDSGVNAEHPHVGRVAGGVRIDLVGEVSGDYVDRIGYGTAVFAAIQEKAPGAELFAVRVFEDRLRTSMRALVAAIDWAAERRVRVVNLSLGTVREEHAEMLDAAVGRLAAVGGVVVAAAEADGHGGRARCRRRWWPPRRTRGRFRGCRWSAT